MLHKIVSWPTSKRLRGLYLLYVLVAFVLMSEVWLRTLSSSDASFYAAPDNPQPGAVLQYAYGEIRYNQDGFPDDEWDAVKTRPRIAYMGDSICYGVGAGHGYRISDLLEAAYPQYEHMNMTGGLGTSINQHMIDLLLERVDHYHLDAVVFILNLNDFQLDAAAARASDPAGPPSLKVRLRDALESLRGRCYLYTYLRQTAKRLLSKGGQRNREMFPSEYIEPIRETAGRINRLEQRLADEGVRLIIVLPPYEMQISAHAAQTYANMGITWEDGAFLDRGPQRELEKHLAIDYFVDGYYAFVDPDDPQASRKTYRIGETFVYNKGERLDWNHPNRLGHQLIARYIEQSGVLENLTSTSTTTSNQSNE
jgi:lysophospholipase L1-like esterase